MRDVAAVADGLVFALGRVWERLAVQDRAISAAAISAELATLREMGVRIDFGDGEVPEVPDAGATAIAVLRDQLRRIAKAAPIVLASGADTFARVTCSDPWPRIYTTAVLQWPASTPVHVMHASDLSNYPDQWAKVGELARFTEIRVLRMFGAPLDDSALPLDLGEFRDLVALDLSASRLAAVPASVGRASALETIELAGNPLAPESLAVLTALSRLRYAGLRGTGLDAAAVAELRARLPADCELALS